LPEIRGFNISLKLIVRKRKIQL